MSTRLVVVVDIVRVRSGRSCFCLLAYFESCQQGSLQGSDHVSVVNPLADLRGQLLFEAGFLFEEHNTIFDGYDHERHFCDDFAIILVDTVSDEIQEWRSGNDGDGKTTCED